VFGLAPREIDVENLDGTSGKQSLCHAESWISAVCVILPVCALSVLEGTLGEASFEGHGLNLARDLHLKF
jgi:hypothetical protein